METSKILFCLMFFALVVLNEARPAQNNSHHGHQIHCSKVWGRRCQRDDECACVNRHNRTLICNYQKKCKRLGPFDGIMRNQPCPKVFKRTCEVHADCPCSERPLICENRECVKAKKCSRVEGRACNGDAQCVCVNQHNTTETLTCNNENRCESPSLGNIMRLQPCPGVFKRRCSVNADCTCSEYPLICEDHECVKARQRFKKAY